MKQVLPRLASPVFAGERKSTLRDADGGVRDGVVVLVPAALSSSFAPSRPLDDNLIPGRAELVKVVEVRCFGGVVASTSVGPAGSWRL